jgi:ribosomal protein S12 methylthiotransferase
MDEYNESRIGEVMEVLCDGYDREENSYYGRTYADSPDIDGRIWFQSEKPVKTGTFVSVLVDGVYDGELLGKAVEVM